MSPGKTKLLLLLLASAWLLAACAGRIKEKTPTNLPGENSGLSDSIEPPLPDQGKAGKYLALAYDPANGSLLKVDREGLFLWRADKGWENINVPWASGLSGIAVNPEHPETVYVSGPGLGVLRSDDGGENWKEINTGLSSLDVTALALHSFRLETVYAWVSDEGVYRTEDSGANWKRMPDQGPPDKEVRGLTHSTLPGSMNTGWLYAATPTGAYISMDCF